MSVPAHEDPFRSLAEPYLRELRLHCYRMLGSLHDADDALQETLVRAWRSQDRFEGRGTFRSWLYMIATNVSLSMATRRPVVSNEGGITHLSPLPDALLEELPSDERDDPAVRHDLHESVQLAFLAAIQLLPPRQRAVLILRDVLGWSSREVAELLDASVASVNSALQRARAALERERGNGRLATDRTIPPDAVAERILRRFLRAWEAVDIDGLVALLKEDAVLTMPPFPMRFVGAKGIGEFLSRVPAGGALDQIRLVPTRANDQPAVAAYMLASEEGIFRAYGIMVLTLDADRIAEITGFSEPPLFAAFDMPDQLGTGN
jgi:RNA polymerase sigma-70 factor (ECF subfamily)